MKKNSANNSNKTAGLTITFDLVIEVLLLVTVFLVATIFDRRLGIVFSGTKVAWLRTFGIIMLSIWAIKILVVRQHRFSRTPLDWPVAGFLFSTTIATLTSIHVYTSFVGFYGRFEGLSTWYFYGLLFFITCNFINSSEQLKRIIMMVVSSATMMAAYSIIQRQGIDPYMWGGVPTKERVIGLIGQPNFLAAYVLMAMFLALIVFLEEKKELNKPEWHEQIPPLGYFLGAQLLFLVMIYSLDAGDVMLWYLGWTLLAAAAVMFAFTYEKLNDLSKQIVLCSTILLMYISLLFTQSRGGYMGLFAGAALFVLIAGRHLIFRNWQKLTILGLLIAAISFITMLNPEYSPFARFTAEVGAKKIAEGQSIAEENKPTLELKGAAGSRGETWKSGFKIVADNPLFGVGPEVLKMVFPRYETDLFRFKETFHVKQDRNHNETLDVPVTKGLITFFVYLWLIFTLFQTGLKSLKGSADRQRLMIAGLLAAVTAYLIQNQFSFGVVAITSLFWVIWGMVMRAGTVEKEQEKEKVRWEEIPWLYVALIGLAALGLIYVSFFSFRADVSFKSGKTLMEMRRLPEAVRELNDSLGVLPFEGTTISHLGIVYLNAGDAPSAIKILNYGNAVDAYNADNFHMLARVYLSLYDRGDKEKLAEARKNAEIALKIDPYYAEAYQSMGMIYERLGQPQAAAKMYQKTFMVNPNLVDAMRDLERVASPAAAFQAFEEAYKKYNDNIVVLEQIGNLYLGRGRIDQAAKVADRMIGVDPQNPAGYTLAGQVALQRGMTDLAFQSFQEAIRLDPKNIAGHLGLGLVYLRQGNRSRAKEEVDQVLLFDPNNEYAKRLSAGLK